MAVTVPDTRENREYCLCPNCPSFPRGCRSENLYCSRGSSACEIHARGCLCPGCLVYNRYSLESLYYCNKNQTDRSGLVIRKPNHDEDLRTYQAVKEIRTMALTGKSLVCSMGSRKQLPFSFDDLHFVPAQVFRIPKNREDPVSTRTVIGPAAERPLSSPSPVCISGMSYGAVSKNVRIIISRVAAQEKIIFNSGEGGVLPGDLEAKDRMIVQYSTGRFGITEDLLSQASAVEIRFGQGAYPGKGSVLPAAKMTAGIAAIRGLKKGEDAYSPAHHPDITSPGQLKEKIEYLRSVTGGAPVGAKIGCGEIEKDISVLVSAGVDFVALDGFGAGTGATNGYVRDNVGIPLIVSVPRAARELVRLGVRNRVSLIAGGGIRTSADAAKCLALGADAVYIGTAALIAINCEQYRLCHTGLCPTGVTTQDPALVAQCDIPRGVERLAQFLRIINEEVANLTRIVGKENVHDLSLQDLISLNRDLARIAGCPWMGDPAEV
jgi:methylamine---glutamate N-methyltransferase subunit C